MRVTRFEDLAVWGRARDLTVGIYQVSRVGPFERDWGLRDQIRRASVSVMSNIAEGFERYSRKEFRYFLSVARGSASEVRSQLYLSRELGYLSEDDFQRLLGLCLHITRMLSALHRKVRDTP